MIRTIKDKITWLDIFQPKDEDIQTLNEYFNLPQDLQDELKKQIPRQKLDQYDDFLFAVTRFPAYSQHKKTSTPQEIDLLIKEDVVATIRYAANEPIEEIFKQADTLEGYRSKFFGKTAAEFLDLLFENIFTYAQRELTHIDKKITQITENIFNDKTNHFKHILEAHDDTVDLSQNQKDTLDSLESTNSSILSSKFDEVTKIISWLAFFLAPFTVVGTLFQINTQFTPIIGKPGDWWIILSITLVCCVLLYWFLKRKKLL